MTPPYVAQDSEGIIAIAEDERFGEIDLFVANYTLRTGKSATLNHISDEEAERIRSKLAEKLRKA